MEDLLKATSVEHRETGQEACKLMVKALPIFPITALSQAGGAAITKPDTKPLKIYDAVAAYSIVNDFDVRLLMYVFARVECAFVVELEERAVDSAANAVVECNGYVVVLHEAAFEQAARRFAVGVGVRC